jgi:hypothetical protein
VSRRARAVLNLAANAFDVDAYMMREHAAMCKQNQRFASADRAAEPA